MTMYPGTDSLMSHLKDTKVTLLLKFAECAPKRKILLPVEPEPGTSRSAVRHLAPKQPTMPHRRLSPFDSTRSSGVCRLGKLAGPQEVSLGKLFSKSHPFLFPKSQPIFFKISPLFSIILKA